MCFKYLKSLKNFNFTPLGHFGQHVCDFFRGSSGAIVNLHSSLSLFVASTRLIRSEVGAIDSPDQSRQVFEQHDTSEVLEKVFQ